jgi:hypothetical protein
MLESIVAVLALLIVTPGWAIALVAISAYIWKWLRSRSE